MICKPKSNNDLEAWRNDPKNWQGDEGHGSAPEVVVHDNSTDPNIGALSQHQQDNLRYLHDDPLHFLNHDICISHVSRSIEHSAYYTEETRGTIEIYIR